LGGRPRPRGRRPRRHHHRHRHAGGGGGDARFLDRTVPRAHAAGADPVPPRPSWSRRMQKDTPAPRKARPAGKAAGSTRTRRDAALQAAAAEPPATSDMALPAESPPKPMARVPMKVRWGDLDAFNHVNNATFLV